MYDIVNVKDLKMEKIKIEEIADELGMQSKELIKRVQLLYKDIKTAKSTVNEKVAQEIFDIILLGKVSSSTKNLSTFSMNNINLHFSSDNIDISMLEKIATTYKEDNTKGFMIRSFNFSELSIVKILVAGLSNLDIKKYVEKKSSKKELELLIKNMNLVLDDVDFENIDEKEPFDDFENYIKKNLPEIVYIEGIDYRKIEQYEKEFLLINSLSKKGIKFEIGFNNIEQINFYNSVENCKKYFTKELGIKKLPKQDAIINIEVSISNIAKKISKKGVLFYILDLSYESNKIQACLCPQYYKKDIEKIDLKTCASILYTMKIKSVFKNEFNEVFYYILNIQNMD